MATCAASDAYDSGEDGDDENFNPFTELESVEAWHTKLTDVGQFSYAALCAIALKELYEDVQWNRYCCDLHSFSFMDN